jgi:peptidoglycan/xylan/chitin deacetylase (PgdA/CDA1 family)
MIVNLGYHNVRQPDGTPGLICPIDRFRLQLEYLRREKIPVLSLREVAKRSMEGQSLPEWAVTLSFDDGLRDGYDNAFPILQKYGFPATFFLVTETFETGRIFDAIKIQQLIARLGARRLMEEFIAPALKGGPFAWLLDPTIVNQAEAARRAYFLDSEDVRFPKILLNRWLPWRLRRELLDEIFIEALGETAEVEISRKLFMTSDEAINLQRAGMEIGAHTHTHPLFGGCSLKEVREEMRTSSDFMKDRFCEFLPLFAWPFGGTFRPALLEEASLYFSGAFNFLPTDKTVFPAPPYNPMDIPRIDQSHFETTVGNFS